MAQLAELRDGSGSNEFLCSTWPHQGDIKYRKARILSAVPSPRIMSFVVNSAWHFVRAMGGGAIQTVGPYRSVNIKINLGHHNHRVLSLYGFSSIDY